MKPILLFLITGMFAFTVQPAYAGYEVGDVATDFNLKNVDGSMLSLKSFEDAKGYIVIFTCNHCPFSKMYEDRIIALHNTYAPKGFPVVAINPNDPEQFPEDSFEGMQQRSKDKQFTFPYLFDETQEIAKAYGAVRTPHVFLLTQSLKVSYIGAIDDNARNAADVEKKYLENSVQALMNGKDPDPNFTKAIGCSIKWRK